MDKIIALLANYHVLVAGLAGGVGTWFIMRVWYKSSHAAPVLLDEAQNEVFTYAPGARRFLRGLAIVSLLFALLPALAFVENPHKEVFPKLALVLGFGFSGVYLLSEVRRYRCILTRDGVTVVGAFSGEQSVAWSALRAVKAFDSLSMLGLTGVGADGRLRRLWVPYTVAGFPLLIARLNAHGVMIATQRPALEAMRDEAVKSGYPDLTLSWFSLPFLSIWQGKDDATRSVIVFVRMNDQGFDGFFVRATSATPREAVRELIELVKTFQAVSDREYAEVITQDLQTMLEDDRLWPQPGA